MFKCDVSIENFTAYAITSAFNRNYNYCSVLLQFLEVRGSQTMVDNEI